VLLLLQNPEISQVWGKNRIVIMTHGTYHVVIC